ncbi:hypothetical protein PR048_000777 [Dryococelus australis]|uniref:Uncharacterized protein n=1 Tax=Dryococelus australis TaxID=614101 RepID=A0ABQ9IFJ8_9NEOP|nr:hypothetical protein PR048_000777 [Dryococelus australis]
MDELPDSRMENDSRTINGGIGKHSNVCTGSFEKVNPSVITDKMWATQNSSRGIRYLIFYIKNEYSHSIYSGYRHREWKIILARKSLPVGACKRLHFILTSLDRYVLFTYEATFTPESLFDSHDVRV